MKPQIILIGGGGHCKSCIDVIEQEDKFEICGIVDVSENLNKEILGYKIIAIDDDLPQLINECKYFIITVGQINSPKKRIEVFQTLSKLGATLPIIVSPFAHVSSHAQIADGTIVLHHALINAGARIGRNCIINSKAIVEHDALIEDHCHISTGAIVNGGVTIGRGTFFGSGSVSAEYVSIPSHSFIKANSLISKGR